MNGLFDEWVLDASFDPPCFCPFERETGDVVIGLAMISGRSPGQLVGVIHHDGQEAVEAWCEAHPNWHSEYGPVAPEPPQPSKEGKT